MTLRLSILGLAVSTLVAVPITSAAPSAPLRRYALVIGSNTGVTGRDRLRYAGHDATTVADVLEQLGGVSHGDLSLLSDPDTRALDSAFDELATRARAQHVRGQRVELVVYYSGHSDETGVLIGGGHYDYARLRERIRAIPADVHIAILDSCESGSFTRSKGGTKLPPFLHDTSNQVEGFAFLSSSSATEDAQESDRIGASFFTYFLVSGLRGAADRNHDGKITLGEAYAFAYEHTLGRTQNTMHGPQHPSYDMHLSGTGDIVITDLRTTESTLVLPIALRGHITILDNTGRVAVELSKDAGSSLELALPNDTYSIYVDNSNGTYSATIKLDHPGEIDFDASELEPASPEATAARGAGLERSEVPHGDDDDDDRGDRSPWYRQIGVGFGGGLRVEQPTSNTGFDSLVTLGGTEREIHGTPVVGVAETTDFALGGTLGGDAHFAYNLAIGFGPGVFIGDNLQLGATIGFGFDGITGGVLGFAWKVPTEAFAVLELSHAVRPMAYVRQNYIFDNDKRQNGTKIGFWGADETEYGAGLRFVGHYTGFLYGSVREMEHVRYYGIGIGAIL
ncbi:MAG TPA: caspase family protein [Kofleriaceae bacterium]|nr:caspase family protein [Kofleriaceae bacterium]